MKYLGIIPARAGSKGIVNKNMVSLKGRPLLSYTFEAAKASRLLSSHVLSSDSQEYLDYAQKVGVPHGHKRHEELANDHASMASVVRDVLGFFKSSHLLLPEHLVLLQPTSPLRTAEHIDEAIRLYEKSGKDCLFSVNPMAEHPYECIEEKESGWVSLKTPEQEVTRRQDYQHRFHFINGAIYIVKTDAFLTHNKFIIQENSCYYIMDPKFGLDIDSSQDLAMAEAFLGLKN